MCRGAASPVQRRARRTGAAGRCAGPGCARWRAAPRLRPTAALPAPATTGRAPPASRHPTTAPRGRLPVPGERAGSCASRHLSRRESPRLRPRVGTFDSPVRSQPDTRAQVGGYEVEVLGVARDVPADERAVGPDCEATAARCVECCADQDRPKPAALVGLVDLGVDEHDQPGVGQAVLRETREAAVDADLEARRLGDVEDGGFGMGGHARLPVSVPRVPCEDPGVLLAEPSAGPRSSRRTRTARRAPTAPALHGGVEHWRKG